MRRLLAACCSLLALAGCGGAPAPHRAALALPRPRRADPAPGRRARAHVSADAVVRRLARLHHPLYCAGRRRRLVALTFDDGPGRLTHLVLRELRRAGARGTFFLVGRSIARFPSLPRRERALGAIGDHTLTHPFLPGLSRAAAAREIAGGRRAAIRAAGPPVDMFRPPYEGRTPAIDAEVARQGMLEVLWDVDSRDSQVAPAQSYRQISATVRRAIGPGAIVLFHENRGQTIRALRGILPALRRRHLRAVTVPELLAADPPSAAQLRAGGRGCRA
ncbi:MAG: polysaccharide deacetylase family protein [Solirubrobacteraceae bacterium]